MRGRFVIGAWLLLLLCLPLYAFAHATPTSYVPESGSSLLSAPEKIEIFFSERIEPEASGIKVYAADGSEAGRGVAVLDVNDPRHFTLPVENKGDGVYTVSWQVVSVDDGHFTRGSFSYLVSAEGKTFEGDPESMQVVYVTKISEAYLHTVTLVGESIMIAVLALYALVIRPFFRGRNDMRYTDAKRITERRLLALMLAGGALFVTSIAVVFVRKSLELGGVREEPLMSSLALFASSAGGSGMLLKAVLGTALVSVWVFARQRIFAAARPTYAEGILALMLVSVLYLQSEISHAAASFFYPGLSVFVTAIHLFFKELLIGGSLVLLVFFGTLVSRGLTRESGSALSRYDLVANVAILMGGLSGVYITWLHLKRFENLWMTEWGERFVLLAVYGGIFFALRLFAQVYTAPRIEKREHLYRLLLPVEVALGLMVLFFSAYISITTPPFTVEQYAFHREMSLENGMVVLEQHPYETEELRIRFVDSESRPLVMDAAIVTLSSPSLGIEANVVPTSPRATGSYVLPKAAFAPSGTWDVSIVGQRRDAYDMRAQFSLSMPQDVADTKYSDDVRVFDMFAQKMLVAAIAIAIVAMLLMLHAVLRVRKPAHIGEGSAPAYGGIPPLHSGIFLGVVLVLVVLGTLNRVMETSLEEKCVGGGFTWQQAYPARDMAPTSQNSLLGCFMHGGHYHLVDEAEFDFVLPTLTLPSE